MPTTRNHTLFFGGILNNVVDPKTELPANDFFIIPGDFDLFPTSLASVFHTWTTPSAFENFKDSLGEFVKPYRIAEQEFEDFQLSTSEITHPVLAAIAQSLGISTTLNHSEIINDVIEAARSLCGAPADAQMVRIYISPRSYRMDLSFEKNDQIYSFIQRSDTYNATIQAHLQTVAKAALMCVTRAINTEPDFWSNVEWIVPVTE